MGLLIFYVALALGVSFLCSIMEAVLLSITPGYIGALRKDDPERAEQLAALKADVDRPLAAILSLNTIAHTVGATGAGAQAVAVFGEGWIGLISAVLTILILVVSEIIPKTLGALYWRGLSGAVVKLLRPTMWTMMPFVAVSKWITRLIARGEKQAEISREEISAMADLGEQHGALAEGESRVLRNLMRFQSLKARDIMTPRTVLRSFQRDMSVGEVMDAHADLRFSRLPIYRDDLDTITGYILKDELWLRAARNELELPLHELERPFLILPGTLQLSVLLERLLEEGEHIALVVDDFGGTAGVVSLEDVIETLLGLEIVDEADSVEDMQALARRKWRERALRLGLVTDEDTPEDASSVLGNADSGTKQGVPLG